MESTRDKILKVLRQVPGVDPSDLDAVSYAQGGAGTGLVQAILKQGIISEHDLLVLLVRELHIPSIDLGKYHFDQRLKGALPEKVARQYQAVPLSSFGDTLTIAVADPLNIFALDDLRNITGKSVDIVIATASQIKGALNAYYDSSLESIAQVSQNAEASHFEIVSEEKNKKQEADTDSGDDAPIIRVVNLLIKGALRQRASDIHIEPMEEGMRVRYRIDGFYRTR